MARILGTPSPQNQKAKTWQSEEIRSTNMASKDLGFSFLIHANLADEYKTLSDELRTSNNFFQGFEVCLL